MLSDSSPVQKARFITGQFMVVGGGQTLPEWPLPLL
jgi:hypothetical protein